MKFNCLKMCKSKKQCLLGHKSLREDVFKVFYESYKAFKRGSRNDCFI